MGIYERIVPDEFGSIAPWLEGPSAHAHLGRWNSRVITARFAHPRRGAPARPAAGIEISGCAVERRSDRAGRGAGNILRSDAARRCEINMRNRPARFGAFADAAYVRDKVFLIIVDLPQRRPGEEERRDARARRVRCMTGGGRRLRANETFGWERPQMVSLDGRIEDYAMGETNVSSGAG